MIQIKRHNHRPHTEDELQWWVTEYVADRIPDYQMAAWLMAVCWQGMTPEETASLTRCMYQSGQVLKWDLPSLPTPPPSSPPSSPQSSQDLALVDKHSTGGVGDKVSIILAPLVASLGVNVPMMAGRGLGHTGGTIDKLESIPGYQSQLSIADFQKVVLEVGCAIVSTTPDVCPADQKLYSLRDVTATVASIPLQTASIVCKKVAEAPHSLVLDAKYGRASFQADSSEALVLAESLIRTAEANGVKSTAFLTRNDHPIGRAVGNWWEVKECIDVLHGNINKGNHDLVTLVVVLAAQMLLQANRHRNKNFDGLVHLVYETLREGNAFEVFRKMVQAQGGDVSLVDDPESFPPPTFSQDIVAPQAGTIANLDALLIGRAGIALGAGRSEGGETVDPGAGVWFHVGVLDEVEADQVLATVYTNRSADRLAKGVEMVTSAIKIQDGGSAVCRTPPIISHFVTSRDGAQIFNIPKVLRDMS